MRLIRQQQENIFQIKGIIYLLFSKVLVFDNTNCKILIEEKMATISDIAKKAGAAPSTVSRVVNGDTSLSISDEKRLIILNIAKQLNYKSPRQRKIDNDKKIPVINIRSNYQPPQSEATYLCIVHFLSPVEELNDPFYTSIRTALEQKCLQYNIPVRRIFKNHLFNHKTTLTEADTVIIIGHYENEEINYMFSLNESLIFIDSKPNTIHVDSVIFDISSAAREIVNLILDNGSKKPAFIGNDNEVRLDTFIELVKKKGIYNKNFCKISKNFCVNSGYEAMLEILKEKELPDVLFAATDMIAIGAMRAIQEKGLQIPNDIQVVGMNDIVTAEHLHTSLSTMRLFPYDMGEAAFALFLERIEGRQAVKSVHLGHKFIWRESFTKKIDTGD